MEQNRRSLQITGAPQITADHDQYQWSFSAI